MNVQLTEIQIDLIKRIARKEGFADFEITTEPGTVKGDNYQGVITAVRIKNGEKKLDLILKSSSANQTLRENVPVKKMYLREIYMYEKIFIEFDTFQREQGLLNGFSAYAKIYGSYGEEPNECLILENLRGQGYTVWNRKVPMNSDHIAFALAEFGKFHAVSLAMRFKKPQLFEKLDANLPHVFDMNDTDITTVLESGFKAVKDNPLATEAFERFSVAFKKSIKQYLSSNEDKLVVVHLDCWCNNLMFKYEDPQDSKKPTHLRILDWQMSTTGSPAIDLAYFFISSSPKEILLDHRRYLKIYYDSVCKTLKEFSCDPETLFPFSLLEYLWKKYAMYGLYVSLILIKLMLGDEEEVPDMTAIAESGKSYADGINFESVHNKDYNQRITDIVLMMAENDLI